MTQASYQTKVRPSAWWYALVALLWIASFVVFVVVAMVPIINAVSTDVTQFGNGDTVSIGSDGLTVYAESTSALGACTLTSDAGSAVDMDRFDSFGEELEVTTTGPTLKAYASTPDDLPPGSYVIACQGGDNTILATGERIDEDAITRGLVIGFVIASILGLIGVVLLIVLLVKRHNSKIQIRAEQSAAYYGAWAQQGYGAPEGTYPPSAYDPYGQHQQQGYGSPQGYAPPPADPYGQPQQPGYDPYGQPQPPADPYAQPGYNPYGQQPPADPHGQSNDPYAQPQPPAAHPYGQPEPTPSDPYAQPSKPAVSDPAPEPSSGSDSDSGSSDDSGSSSDSGSSDGGSSSDSNHN